MTMLSKEQKVFGVGLSRTGTTSLAKALNALGVRTKHYPADDQTLSELRSGNYRLSVLDKFQGVVDITVAPYYAQLDALYPNSKFVLTIRDMDSWLRSIREHWRVWMDSDPHKEFTRFICACVYGALEVNEERFAWVFRLHVRNVQAYFDGRGDLLVMDIAGGDGWEKLCPFLGLPVPNVPFPHANQMDENRRVAELRESARRDLATHVPQGSIMILVGSRQSGIYRVPGRQVVSLLERDGMDWGAPPDSDAAIHQLERQSVAGASFIAFTWTAFWWLQHYSEFADYLRSRFHCVAENERLVLFDLRG